jgi:hypothetical protein
MPAVPSTFDAFRLTSSNAFGTKELAHAIQGEPSLTLQALCLGNAMAYAGQTRIKELEQALMETFKSHSADAIVVRAAITFTAGTLLGWMLCWLAALV